ncbi:MULTISPECIES: GntR family transcriptional regulator [Pseudonocardia]|uniref:GntR family transcriptional regulator n=2 Tax=Pseudonocardia TaxID=1847 RepID=A0ABQ0S364_9PSEU|nr:MULTISPECIES: GntR family transcriptional regulator [Pseudonocardia]OSY35837.1 putative HTH-type transcriptional regulator YdfH [Pseudonocardia autotrophica]TDN73131.1 GntR family transcriptional regulator [Pseudonocardia autotrophica]BBG03850.1 GntR family transcriptional regulator [Pseudonocardia autotrophica]GEC27351.1 GntR family transcriptional regulator [Pseudonocardia saturnea]
MYGIERGSTPTESGKGFALYIQLRDDVVNGRYPPGTRLSESSLGREYGVSRTPIREAIARLEHDGLLLRQGAYASVRTRSAEEVIDIYRIRVILEKAIAHDAALRRRETDLIQLHRAFDAEADVDRSDAEAVAAANREFHSALALAAHNEPLLELQYRLTLQISIISGTTLSQAGRWEQARSEHAGIIAAVEAQDPDSAGAAAEMHMTSARAIRLRMLGNG